MFLLFSSSFSLSLTPIVFHWTCLSLCVYHEIVIFVFFPIASWVENTCVQSARCTRVCCRVYIGMHCCMLSSPILFINKKLLVAPLYSARRLDGFCRRSFADIFIRFSMWSREREGECLTIAHRSWIIRCDEWDNLFWMQCAVQITTKWSILMINLSTFFHWFSFFWFSFHRIVYGFTSSIICSRVPGLTPAQRQLCAEVPDAFVALGAGHMLGAQECQHQFKGECSVFGHQHDSTRRGIYYIIMYASVCGINRSSMELHPSLEERCLFTRCYCRWVEVALAAPIKFIRRSFSFSFKNK